MSQLGLILLIFVIIALMGGFTGVLGGPGYGFGHIGIGVPGLLLVILIILLVSGRL